VLGPDLSYVDSTGRQWPVALESGRIELQNVPRYFEFADCTGPYYVASIPPRYVFNLDGTARVRADNVTATRIAAGAYRDGAGPCHAMASTQMWAVSEADLTAVGIVTPALTFVPPLHREISGP
jgi:hypothetical protein